MNSKTYPAVCTILVLAVVFVSGCVSNSTTTETGNGVIIKDYDVEFSDVYSGECVDFSALLKNTGSLKAEGVFAEIIGIDYTWNDKKAWNKGCGPKEDGGPWVSWEKDANEEGCRFKGTYTTTLSPPDPAMNVDGQAMTCSWSFKAPLLPERTEITYKPVLRVFYKYQTDVIKAVTLMSQQEMKNLVEQGLALPIDTQSSTSSPVSVDVIASTPTRTYTDTIEFPITINIDNIGGGIVCAGSTIEAETGVCRPSQNPEEFWNKLKLKIETDKGITLSDDCKGNNGIIDLTLYQGRSNSITCTVTVKKSDLPSDYVKKKITVHAYYIYMLDNEIQVTLHGPAA